MVQKIQGMPEQEEIYKALFQSATIGIVGVNKDGIIELANPFAAELFGYEQEGLVGKPLSMLIPDSHRDRHRQYHSEYFKNPKVRSMGHGIELSAKKKDGTSFPVDISLNYYQSNGKRLALAYIVDITKQKKFTEDLKLEEQRTRLLIEHTPAAVAMFDNQMRYIAASQRWLNDYHLHRKVIGFSHYEIFPDIPERWKEIHRRCLAGETLSNNEDGFTRADGNVDWVRWEICPWHLTNNEIGGIIIFSEVLTEQKQNQERYKNLFENSLAAMFIFDLRALKIIDANEPAVALFGYQSKEDLIRNYDYRLHVVNPDERDENISHLREGDEVTSEMELKKLDGTRFWVKIFVKVNKEKTVSQSIVIDVTETKVAQEKLEAKVKERTLELATALERERELNDMKSRFVTMASHEFRTPLSAILSSVFLIESSNDGNYREKIDKHSKRIRTSVKNLTDILNEFLSLEKLEQGKVDIHLESFDLSDFLEDIVEDMRNLLKPEQHLIFSHTGDAQIVQDKRILKNSLNNLLSNAIKYTPENKKIYLTSEVGKKKVRITVKDEGIGIPKDEQKGIFDKFFRARNATNFQGTGLGLNIVKRYMELIDGEINFTSEPETGSTFTIEFALK